MPDDEYEIVRSPRRIKSGYYIRKKRDRKADATEGELRTRIAFGKAAMGRFGDRGITEVGPVAAKGVKKELEGQSYSEEERVVLSDEILTTLRLRMLEKGITSLELPSRFTRKGIEVVPEISE